MEIIIHGKPYSDSCQQSGGLDESFVSSFTSSFFRESGLLKELGSEEALIVDARNWKGKWYGVYTYALRVSDFANTPGAYFAISVVFSGEYNCFTRDVSVRLKRVCREYVVGRYLSQHGKYLVKDFGDTQMFEGLVAILRNNWDAIVESFDSKFIPQNEFSNDIRYNIDDCDSQAYLDAWRKHGRIIITPNTPSKDALIGNKEKEASTIREQQQTIIELKKQLNDAQKKEQLHITTSSKQQKEAQRLQQKNDELKSDNNSLLNSLQDFSVWADKLGKEAKDFVEKSSRRMAGKFPVTGGDISNGTEKHKTTPRRKKARNWMQWVVVIVLVFSVVTNILVLRDINSKCNSGNCPVEPSDSTVVGDSTQTDTSSKDSLHTEVGKVDAPQFSYKIDIDGYLGRGSLKVGSVYTLRLLQQKKGERQWIECPITPTWLVDGIPSSNRLTSDRQKNVTISCIINGKEIPRPDNPLAFVNPTPSKSKTKDTSIGTTTKKVVEVNGGATSTATNIQTENQKPQ